MKFRQLITLIASFILLFAFGTVALAQTVPQATPTPEAEEEADAEADAEIEADAEAELPNVQVSEQGVVDGRVNIVRALVPGPAWVVIHADADGRPGPVIGHAALETGENTDIVVEVDVDAVTPLLHAMLHVDEGEVGTYEFPGVDEPLTIEDDIVMAMFSAAPPVPPTPTPAAEEEAEAEAATSTEAPGAEDEAEPEADAEEVEDAADTEDEAETMAAEATPEAAEEAEEEPMAEPTPMAEEEAEMAAPDADAKGAAPEEMPSTGAGAPLAMILTAIAAVVSALGGSVVFSRRHRA